MATTEVPFRLDTGAWVQARATRWSRRALLALALGGAAALLVVLIAVVTSAIGQLTASSPPPAHAHKGAQAHRPLKQAPWDKLAVAAPPSATPVAIWNGYGGQGAATAASTQIRSLGYPIAAVGNAPTLDYRATIIYFTRNQRPAATALAKRMGLSAAAAIPIDGIQPKAIRPAKLLVILGH